MNNFFFFFFLQFKECGKLLLSTIAQLRWTWMLLKVHIFYQNFRDKQKSCLLIYVYLVSWICRVDKKLACIPIGEWEWKWEREFVFNAKGSYVEMEAQRVLSLKAFDFGVSSFLISQGFVSGLWVCVFSFHSNIAISQFFIIIVIWWCKVSSFLACLEEFWNLPLPRSYHGHLPKLPFAIFHFLINLMDQKSQVVEIDPVIGQRSPSDFRYDQCYKWQRKRDRASECR